MKLFYSNKEGPRVYVYRDKNGPSGYGVTLNFAHRKAWIVMAVHIIPWIFVAPLAIVNPSRLRSSTGWLVALLMYCGCVVVMSLVLAYRGASRDLKRYPGPKGPRKQKGLKVK